MDQAQNSRRPARPPRLARLWIRSALAPATWSRWCGVGVLGIAAVAGVEAAVGAHTALASALAVVALVIGLTGGRGDAIAVAAACVTAAALSGLTDTWDAPWTITLVVVGATSVTAVLVSLLRATAITTARQLDLLRDLAQLAHGTRTVEELTDGLLDVLVPAYADASTLDLAIHGYERRIGARVAGLYGRQAEGWLRARPPVAASMPGAQRSIVTGQPSLLENVDDDLLQRIALDDADLEHLRRMGARSLLSLPLATRGAPFGALSMFVGPSGRRYHSGDLEFAQLVQGRVAIVLDNTGLSRAAARSEAIMSAALDTLEEAVTMNGPDGRTVYVNQAAVRLLKADTADELLRAEPGAISERFDVYDEAGDPVSLEDLPAFKAIGGEDHPDALLVRNVVRATGEERWLLNKVSVLHDAAGGVDRIVNVIEDVTQVKQAEVRQRLLAEATRLLSSTAEPRTLARVAEILVPQLADWCCIDVQSPSGLIESAAIAHAVADRVALGRELRAAYPIQEGDADPIAQVVAEGATLHVPSIPDEALQGYAKDERHLELLRAIGVGTLLVVPLMAGGRQLGAITLIRADPRRSFLDQEVRLAEELGHRAGLAVLSARLSAERATITHELQEGLRPPVLPEVPGLDIATLYRPAGELNDVGGDFYDAFPAAGGWTVFIGDVAGQGARAAALTGLARFTLRTVARHTGDLEEAVAAVNRMLGEQAHMALCTLAVLRLYPEAGNGVALDSLSAGHPLPILVRDGSVRELGAPGPIAGVFEEAAWERTTTLLADGDTILLYTDGVLDTVGSEGRFGDQRLLALLEGAPADPSALVARIDAALAAFQRGPQRDDTAIVAITVRDSRALATAIPAAHATA